jgi:hypothetical protein
MVCVVYYVAIMINVHRVDVREGVKIHFYSIFNAQFPNNFKVRGPGEHPLPPMHMYDVCHHDASFVSFGHELCKKYSN